MSPRPSPLAKGSPAVPIKAPRASRCQDDTPDQNTDEIPTLCHRTNRDTRRTFRDVASGLVARLFSASFSAHHSDTSRWEPTGHCEMRTAHTSGARIVIIDRLDGSRTALVGMAPMLMPLISHDFYGVGRLGRLSTSIYPRWPPPRTWWPRTHSRLCSL
jgi:hypothetical protein